MSHRNLAALRHRDESWDYRGEPTKAATHGLHGYPAMMIPQVAARLIEEHSAPGDVILDPFCGSGSVLVEAGLRGRSAWGIDLNPLAVLIARVKTTWLDTAALADRLATIRTRLAEPGDAPPPPAIPNLEFWFKPPAIADLSAIRAAWLEIPDVAEREFFQVAFSATVREVSNTRSSEFKLYRYDESRLAQHHPDARAIFAERARANIARLAGYLADRPAGVWARPRLGDSRQRQAQIPTNSVQAIITSPPYGDSRTTVAYGQFSRLSAQWLGLIPAGAGRDLDRALLGGQPAAALAMPHHSPTLQKAISYVDEAHAGRAREVLAFFLDLNQCLERLAEYLAPGGAACLVVGNRRVKGRELPTDIIVCELGESLGLIPEQIVIRGIPAKRMPLRNSPSNVAGETGETMVHERIVILRKPA